MLKMLIVSIISSLLLIIAIVSLIMDNKKRSLKADRLQECPICKGKGFRVTSIRASHDGFDISPESVKLCSICKGEGFIKVSK